MKIPLKIDFSTDDVITPGAIIYGYPMLFEDRAIDLLSYNLETILSEKMETLLARTIVNTRMRDFYDLYALGEAYAKSIDFSLLRKALINTATDRGSRSLLEEHDVILSEIEKDAEVQKHWAKYQQKYDYASSLDFSVAMAGIRGLFQKVHIATPDTSTDERHGK
jgi:predicted nucleotidyltransferase component of viral defense system